MRVKQLSQIFALMMLNVFFSNAGFGEDTLFRSDSHLLPPKEKRDKTLLLMAQLDPSQSSEVLTTDSSDADQTNRLSPGQYRVAARDTLWSIARRLRFDGISVVQTMEAIFRYNSSAFDGDDVSSLEIGAMIWLPTSDEVRLEFGTFVSPGLERIDPKRMQTQALLSSIDRSAKDEIPVIPYKATSPESSEIESSGAEIKARTDKTELIDLIIAEESKDDLIDDATDSSLKNEQSPFESEFAEDFELISMSDSDVDTNSSFIPQDPSVADGGERKIGTSVIVSFAAVMTLLASVFAFSVRRNPRTSEDLPSRSFSASPDQSSTRYDEFEGEEIKLFDETDQEIFPDENHEVTSRFFDSMIDPMVDAEMYLSVGKIAQAIDVLQEERFAKPRDVACRVRLMQVLLEEKKTDDLAAILKEIESIGDQESINIGKGIVSESRELGARSVQSLSDDIYFDSPTEFVLVHEDSGYTDAGDSSRQAEETGEDTRLTKLDLALSESEDKDIFDKEYDLDSFSDLSGDLVPEPAVRQGSERLDIAVAAEQDISSVAENKLGIDFQSNATADNAEVAFIPEKDDRLSRTDKDGNTEDLMAENEEIEGRIDDEIPDVDEVADDDAQEITPLSEAALTANPNEDKQSSMLGIEDDDISNLKHNESEDQKNAANNLNEAYPYESGVEPLKPVPMRGNYVSPELGEDESSLSSKSQSYRAQNEVKQDKTDNFKLLPEINERGEVNPLSTLGDELDSSQQALMRAEKPGTEELNEFDQGDVLSGVVRDITPLGAAIDLGHRMGFLNVNDIDWVRVSHPSQVLNIDDAVDVMVLEVTPKNGKIMVGMKQLKDDPWNTARDSVGTVNPKISAAPVNSENSARPERSQEDSILEWGEDKPNRLSNETESDAQESPEIGMELPDHLAKRGTEDVVDELTDDQQSASQDIERRAFEDSSDAITLGQKFNDVSSEKGVSDGIEDERNLPDEDLIEDEFKDEGELQDDLAELGESGEAKFELEAVELEVGELEDEDVLEKEEFEDEDVLEEEEFEDEDVLEEEEFEDEDESEEEEFEDEDEVEKEEFEDEDESEEEEFEDGVALGENELEEDLQQKAGFAGDARSDGEDHVSKEFEHDTTDLTSSDESLSYSIKRPDVDQIGQLETESQNNNDTFEDNVSLKPSSFFSRLFGKTKPPTAEIKEPVKRDAELPSALSGNNLPETISGLSSQERAYKTSTQQKERGQDEPADNVQERLGGMEPTLQGRKDHIDTSSDLLSEVRVTDRNSLMPSSSAEVVGLSDNDSSSLIVDDFDEIFENDDPLIQGSESIAPEADTPMVNPEDLGVLKYFDDAEEMSENPTSFVPEAPSAADLKDELLGFEKFLNIQSTLVNKSDSNDKGSLNLFNIDSADVKFEIVDAYISEGNFEGAKELLSDITEQADSEKNRARAQSLLDTLQHR